MLCLRGCLCHLFYNCKLLCILFISNIYAYIIEYDFQKSIHPYRYCRYINFETKQCLLYSSENLNVYLKIQWIFVILLGLCVIRDFEGTCSPVEMLNGYRVRKKLGTDPVEMLKGCRVRKSWERTLL